MHLVEELCSSSHFSLSLFCSCVDKVHPVFALELRQALAAEIGAIEIEEQMHRDSIQSLALKGKNNRPSTISRRFSESDKRQISSMISMRSHLAMVSSREQVKQLAQELMRLKVRCIGIENVVREINSKLDVYIRQNDLSVIEALMVEKSTNNNIFKSFSGNDPVEQLSSKMDFVMSKLVGALAQRDYFWKKFEKKFKFLSGSSTKNNDSSRFHFKSIEMLQNRQFSEISEVYSDEGHTAVGELEELWKKIKELEIIVAEKENAIRMLTSDIEKGRQAPSSIGQIIFMGNHQHETHNHNHVSYGGHFHKNTISEHAHMHSRFSVPGSLNYNATKFPPIDN